MSAPDGPPQEDDATAEPGTTPAPRVHGPGCAVRVLLAGALVAVLSFALALAFLDSAAGGAAARMLLERWASTTAGGPVRIDKLDLHPWRAGATATAASLRLEAVSLDVERIDASWSPGSGASVRLVRAVVVVRDTGEPEEEATRAEGFAAQPWRLLENVGRAEVIEGRVEMRDMTGAPWLVLGRVDAVTRPGSRRIGVRIADAAVGWPAGGLRLKPATAEAELSLDEGGLVFEEVRIATGGSSLEIRGRLDRLSPITASADARVAVDGDLVAALSPGTEVTGRVEGDVAVNAVENRVKGTLSLASPALTVMGVGPWRAIGHGRIEGARLVLDPLTAEGYGGRLVVEGSLALAATAKTDARVRAEGIDVAALARAFSKAEVPVAARADASLHWATTGWDVDAARGTGQIALRPAERAGRRAAPGVPLTGSGRLVVEGRALALEGAHVEAHGARLEADARLAPDGRLGGAWRARLPLPAAGALAADVGSEARVPEGFVGELVAEGELAGTASKPEVSLRLMSEGLSAHGRALTLEGEMRYAGGRLSLAPLIARSGEGNLTLTGSLPARRDAGDWDLQGDAQSFDLAPVLALAGIEGRGEATGTLRVAGEPATPRGRAELSARLSLPAGEKAEEVTVALSAEGEAGRVRVSRLEADLAGGRVEGSGAYDSASRAVEAKARASGLAWSRLPLLPEAARRLGGTLAADVTLSGTADAPAGDAQARLAGSTLDGSPLPELALDARGDGRRLAIAGRAGGSSFLEGAGTLEGDWPMRLEVDVAALPAQALLDAVRGATLDGATIEARGRLVADVALRDAKQLRYTAEGLAAGGRVKGLEWSTEPFRLEGTAEEASLAGFRLTTRAAARAGEAPSAEEAEAGAAAAGGTLIVDGRIPLAKGRAFDLALRGDFTLAAIEAVVPDSRAGGRASLQAHVRGALAAPDVGGTFEIVDGRVRVKDTRISAVQVTGRFQGGEALVERASARLLGGTLTATGSLPIGRLDAGHAARFRFEATDVDLSRFAIPFAERTAESPSFLVSMSGELAATAPGLAGLRGEGRFTKLESRSTEGTVGLATPAAWRLADGHLVQDPLRLDGPLGTLEASADVVLTGTPKGSFSLAGPFDLRLVGPFVPDTTLAGPALVDLRGEWDGSGVRLQGALTVDDGRLTLETLAFSASQVKGEVRFLGDRAEVDATAASGDGRLVVYGSLHFSPRLLGPVALSIEAERVPVAYPEGFRGRATGAILVEGDAGRYRASGLVDLTQAYYTAEFDARKESLDRLDYQVAALRGQGSVLESLPLAVDVRFQDPLRIRNSQAQVDVVGTLTANGTLAQPIATGQVSLLGGGQVTIRRARIRVHEGRVELNGYPAGVPEVDFEGLTQVGGVTMSLRAQGSMDDLQLDIRSPNRPELSQTDLVSLLLTGRTSQAAASEGGAIVAEELAAALGGALQKGVGETFLIDVSSDASMLLDEGDPTQRFKIGTRVGRDLAVFYSTRLDGTEQRWVGQWNPRGGRFTFRAIQDSEEGTIVEATDRLSFNVFPRREAPGRRTSAPVSKLESLSFEGELPLPEEELRRSAKLKAGKRYDPLRLARAADQVRERLVEGGFRGATVEAIEREAGRKGHVDLVLKVAAGPRIVVTWSGDVPAEKVRQHALEAWPPYASPEAAAASVARTARIALQAEGHYGAEVGHELRGTEGETEVVLKVVQGPKGQGIDVVFEGNQRLTTEELTRTLPQPGSREFFWALDRRARLVAGARVAYAGLGHIRARVGPARTRFDAASGRLTVTLPVREGAAARVSALNLPDGLPPPAEGGPELTLAEGRPFGVEAYLADRDAVTAWYRREGFMEARVRGLLEPSGGDVRVTIAADPGPRPRLGEVRIASDGRTQERLVRRAIQARPGEVIRPQELAETRARLSELGTFSSVDVRTVPVPGREDVRDLEVSYVERPDVELEYGLRYNLSAGGSGTSSGTTPTEDAPSGPSEGRLQAAAALWLASPFGYGWRLGGYTLQTSARHNYRLGLQSSTLFGLRVKTQILAFDEADDDSQIAESFASKVRGFSVQQSRTLLWDTGGRRWHERMRLQWGYTNKDIQYSEEIGGPDIVAGNRAFLSVALIGDERDSLTDPRKGVFWTATTEWARRFLGSDVDYVRLYGQLFTYLPVLRGVVWAQGLRAGVVPGDDPFYLLENRFQAGGPTTVRGFRQNGLGPQLTEDEGLGGQGVFVMNQELRFPIWKSLKGGVFWDAGNSWLWAYEFSLRDLRHTVGGGLRIMFPFGPVRLEYGFILDRRETEPRGRFVFGLGHAF